MNPYRSLFAPLSLLLRLWPIAVRLLPKQRSNVFGKNDFGQSPKIEKIYVINLDRRADRWAAMRRNLNHIIDSKGRSIIDLTTRRAAIDANDLTEISLENQDIYPFYTLEEQLLIEPQPQALPEHIAFSRPIPMTLQEVAVALSHINTWRKIANGNNEYVLILEDDVWFQLGFGRKLDKVWKELILDKNTSDKPDLLYLSYSEVKNGAQKTYISDNTFCPVRGLWYMSGYVLSKKGAQKLIELLPCRGPVDLWINHQFDKLTVRASRQSIILQTTDNDSSNSYSVIPVLNRIGAIDSEGAALFQIKPTEQPVFVFGSKNSGLSSAAMALSLLGYRCCSDLEDLPKSEYDKLLTGTSECIFNAYVNIGSLADSIEELRRLHPAAKFIFTLGRDIKVDDIKQEIVGIKESDAFLSIDETNKWQILCEHLRCAPPICPFPQMPDIGQRHILDGYYDRIKTPPIKTPKRDKSPWVIESKWKWKGIKISPATASQSDPREQVDVNDSFQNIDQTFWSKRDDTFSGNLALFRPYNIEKELPGGITLKVNKESLKVRDYSAAALTSCHSYLYGRFEALFQASCVPGIVTGFFLQRDSPRQEIDLEIAGNKPDRLLINVFYNPGTEGIRYDYGYRGAPSKIDLGFNASEAPHHFAIEWTPDEILWYVDNILIHKRLNWDPTPIPHLPMKVHLNTWPSRSKELAGRLKVRTLPTKTTIKTVKINATRFESRPNGKSR